MTPKNPPHDSSLPMDTGASRAEASQVAEAILSHLRGARSQADNAPSSFEESMIAQLKVLASQLAPLGQLAPVLQSPPQQMVDQLLRISAALEAPKWSNVGRIDARDRPARPSYRFNIPVARDNC